MKSLKIRQKLFHKKFYVHEKILWHKITPAILSKIYFLQNAKKTCKPINCDLDRDELYIRCAWANLQICLKSKKVK